MPLPGLGCPTRRPTRGPEGVEACLGDGRPGLGHQIEDEGQVVDAEQSPGGGLAHPQQVAEVAPGPPGAGRAAAVGVEGPVVVGVDGVAQVELARRG